jgi:hypothetical protein
LRAQKLSVVVNPTARSEVGKLSDLVQIGAASSPRKSKNFNNFPKFARGGEREVGRQICKNKRAIRLSASAPKYKGTHLPAPLPLKEFDA